MSIPRTLLILFFLSLWIFASANSRNDTIQSLIASSSGIEKAEAQIELATLIQEEDSIAKAEMLFNEALDYLTSLNSREDRVRQLKIKAGLGLSHIMLFNQAEYQRSLDLLYTTLNLAKELKDSAAIAVSCQYLGFNYRFLSKYPKAIEFLDEAILIASSTKDTATWISILNEKANVHYFLHEFKQCRDIRLLALRYAVLSNNRYAQSYISHDLAFLYLDAGEYRKALDLFLVNMTYSLETGAKREIAIAAGNIADIYIQLKNSDSAVYYFAIADTITERYDLVYERSLVMKGLSEAYALKGDYGKAHQFLTQYLQLSENIFNLDKEKQINELSARYEMDKKEQENLLLKQQYRNTLQITLIIAGFVMIIIILLLWINRKKQLINRELEEQNDIIQRQKDNLDMAFEILRKREEELDKANSAKDMFFSIIAHDLKNPFNTLLGFTNLLRTEYSSFNEQEISSIIKNINESSIHLFKLLENLLEWTRTQTNRIEVKPESFDIVSMIRQNIEFAHSAADNKGVSVNFGQDRPSRVFADSGMIDFVIRNLLSNAVKYVPRGGQVTFSLNPDKESIIVQVKDTGIGIPQDNISKLFQIDGKVKTEGTEHEKGTGLGLIICKEFLELNHGKIWVESSEGQGSKFYFSIPRG